MRAVLTEQLRPLLDDGCHDDHSIHRRQPQASSSSRSTPIDDVIASSDFGGERGIIGAKSGLRIHVSSCHYRSDQPAGNSPGTSILSRMNRNPRGCSIVIRGDDSRGCHGKRTVGTLR
jgi:hypothetical protein